VGSAIPLEEKLELAIRGRDIATGLPREIIVKNTQIRIALARSLKQILDAAREVIEGAPPELAGDIYKNGVYLSGGGSQLRGLEYLVAKELSVKASIVDDPLRTVVRGIGQILEHFDHYRRYLENPQRPKEISL
jgi:rod shape-determining protein MreB and related proteins